LLFKDTKHFVKVLHPFNVLSVGYLYVLQACAVRFYETSYVCSPKRLLNVQMFISKAKRKKDSGVGRTKTLLCDAPKFRIAQLLAVIGWWRTQGTSWYVPQLFYIHQGSSSFEK
jgi:hypothetical protein